MLAFLKGMMKKVWFFTITVALSSAAHAGSRDVCAIPQKQVQIEVEKVVPVKPVEQGITAESMALMVPTDMAPSNDSNQIRNEIMDHNVKNLMQGKYIRNNELIKTAQKVQEVMQPKMTFGGGDSGVQHSVNMEFEAFQQVAKLRYEGFLKSDVSYEAPTQNMSVAVSEDLNTRTQVTMEHTSADDLSYLKINWNW